MNNKWWARRCRHADEPTSEGYLPFFDGRACARADAATDFVLADERPSRSAADSLRATVRDVCFEFLAMVITSSCSIRSTRAGCVLVSVEAWSCETMKGSN